MDHTKLSPKDILTKTTTALVQNGMTVDIVASKEAAKALVQKTIPEGSQVMTMTSITLEQSGIQDLIDVSGKYLSVRKLLATASPEEKRHLGAAPTWAIASAHAVTESGHILIASNTGSQLPATAYGAEHVILVVSTKKIVPDFETGLDRITKHIMPLESVRARKAYGLPDTWHTNLSKLLVINKEVTENRIHVIFVEEDLGF